MESHISWWARMGSGLNVLLRAFTQGTVWALCSLYSNCFILLPGKTCQANSPPAPLPPPRAHHAIWRNFHWISFLELHTDHTTHLQVVKDEEERFRGKPLVKLYSVRVGGWHLVVERQGGARVPHQVLPVITTKVLAGHDGRKKQRRTNWLVQKLITALKNGRLCIKQLNSSSVKPSWSAPRWTKRFLINLSGDQLIHQLVKSTDKVTFLMFGGKKSWKICPLGPDEGFFHPNQVFLALYQTHIVLSVSIRLLARSVRTENTQHVPLTSETDNYVTESD